MPPWAIHRHKRCGARGARRTPAGKNKKPHAFSRMRPLEFLLACAPAMPAPENRNDWLTVAALGLLATCIVTFDHEALGHGSACLLLHGHIRLLSSSLFRCDVRSGWIDPAGPATNLLVGTLALVCLRFVPERLLNFRLLLILITAFSYFWESGYVMRAMLRRDGDLYYFAQFLLGDVSVWQRCVAAGAGLALFVFAARLTSNALLKLWPQTRTARAVARTAWTAAIVGSAAAALAYAGPGWSGNLRDAVLEVGAASFPLLLIPPRNRPIETTQPPAFLARSTITIVLALAVYAIFVATLGRGLISPAAVAAPQPPAAPAAQHPL